MLPKLSLKHKLITLVSIAIVSFILAVLPFAKVTYKNYQQTERALEAAEITDILIHTTDELEKERGLSTAYIASNINFFKNKMYEERNIVDINLTKLKDSIINSPFNGKIKENLLKKITEVENIITDARKNTFYENDYLVVFKMYDKAVEKLLSIFKDISQFNDYIKETIYPIDRIKNIEGKLRTVIGAIIATEKIKPELKNSIKEWLIEKKTIKKYYLTEAETVEAAKIENSREGKFFYATLKLILKNKILENITPINWWKVSLNYISKVEQFEYKLLNREVKTAKNNLNKAKKDLIIFTIFFIFTLSALTFLFWTILKDIYENINNLKKVLLSATKGDFNTKMDEKIPGEMGKIAKNVNKILKSFQQFMDNEKIFIASVSHELRTPLNGIIGFLNLLKLTDLNKEQKIYVENSLTASKQLLELIEDLLDTTKIQTGQIEIRNEEFDINKIINDISKTLQIKLQKDVEIKVNIPQFENYLIGDPKRIKQIFYNLLSNAIKYTKEGYVEIGIKELKEKDDTVEAEFYVKDTGIGIPKDKQDKIFKPFSRAHEKDIKGTGLGLYISKNLAKLMGGDIYFESEEGKGTTFFLKLKLKKGRKKSEKFTEKIKTGILDFSNISILIAEDETINQKLLSKILEKNFNIKNIKIVENGEKVYREAVKNKNKYDLILLDLQMPIMDGLTALEKIRRAGIKTPIYILTADAYRESEEKAKKLGANGYITKPINLEKLREILEKVNKEKGSE